jgi:hypothetical protein
MVIARRSLTIIPRFLLTILVCLASIRLTIPQQDAKWRDALTPAGQQALSVISADSLRGHLSFIASDLLEGRKDGSPGEAVAAEYIAAQFRRAGLKPAGNDGYFQSAPKTELTPAQEGYKCLLKAGDRSVEISPLRFVLADSTGSRTALMALHIDDAEVIKVPFGGNLAGQFPDMHGKVILTDYPATPDRGAIARRQEFLSRLAAAAPALIAEVRGGAPRDSSYFSNGTMVDYVPGERQPAGTPIAILTGDAVAKLYAELPEGAGKAVFTLHLGGPKAKQLVMRNVVGMLPGSDPAFADRYILLTAHYDGVGPRPGTSGGWDAANDDGSGTVSVIEIAAALASMKERPRSSIVFMTFYGEEAGGLGSRYYAEHPLFPIEKTIADINLEQVGRTDSSEGDQSRRASLTGFDYSDLGQVFRRAGELTEVTVYKHEKNSDPYFAASDNVELANIGIPAHTLCVAYMFADYHGPGDTWQKINYENMALTDRMITTALLILANSDREPRWNAGAPQASRYLAAWKKNHEAGK